ncbi:MAG: bifunctional diaminohydroxyphosphoribosylaminopyrimidine deaminase/5-amino-6-(5-phosphoribosylamino)uracil reductase RibD, partial [Lachnospiraceae bacterium]
MNHLQDGFNPRYMKIAIGLALRGAGKVNPNPLVGAVIVKNGQVIGSGYHTAYGRLHAEREAFRSLKNPADAEGADLYVTLEPCCHQGKQPPCTDAIIRHKISRVFVGSADPNPLVAGKGNQILRSHGIEVFEDCLREECDRINEIFLHYIRKKKPYVMMKYAMTLDGKIATVSGKSRWITGPAARKKVHEDRNRLAAIMVGIGTVL